MNAAEVRDVSPTWGLPSLALATGIASLPVMFLGSMSFVVSMALATASAMTCVAVFIDGHSVAQRLLALVGACSAPLVLALLLLPYVFQD